MEVGYGLMKRRKPRQRPTLAERREIAVRAIEADGEIESLPETPDERAVTQDETRKKFSQSVQDRFLRLYAMGATEREAARVCGVSPITVRRARRSDPEFDKRYLDAREFNTDEMEDTLRRIAADGHVTAIFGILRARRPEVWRERATVDANVTQDVTASAELFNTLIKALQAKASSESEGA